MGILIAHRDTFPARVGAAGPAERRSASEPSKPCSTLAYRSAHSWPRASALRSSAAELERSELGRSMGGRNRREIACWISRFQYTPDQRLGDVDADLEPPGERRYDQFAAGRRTQRGCNRDARPLARCTRLATGAVARANESRSVECSEKACTIHAWPTPSSIVVVSDNPAVAVGSPKCASGGCVGRVSLLPFAAAALRAACPCCDRRQLRAASGRQVDQPATCIQNSHLRIQPRSGRRVSAGKRSTDPVWFS